MGVRIVSAIILNSQHTRTRSELRFSYSSMMGSSSLAANHFTVVLLCVVAVSFSLPARATVSPCYGNSTKRKSHCSVGHGEGGIYSMHMHVCCAEQVKMLLCLVVKKCNYFIGGTWHNIFAWCNFQTSTIVNIADCFLHQFLKQLATKFPRFCHKD